MNGSNVPKILYILLYRTVYCKTCSSFHVEAMNMAYQELKGNIFNSKADTLVNTVNCVGVMGKGIALEFRRRFPQMFDEYQKICSEHKLKPGQILPYKRQTPWILNFAIKDDWKFPSKLWWIESCLDKFAQNYKAMGITSIAFPWMGAMNGGIPLEQIQAVTRKHLSSLPDISIEVYDFDKTAVDPLFEKLKEIAHMSNPDWSEVSKVSTIQLRYLMKIIDSVKKGEVLSLSMLIDAGIIGDKNIDKLYAFLVNPIIDVNRLQKSLFLF